MLRQLVATLALLAVGCSSSAPHAQASPSHSSAAASSTPAASASPGPSNSPAPGQPVARVAFSCRLPVVTFTTGGDGISYQGGFITFPSGAYADDPKGLIVSVYPQGGFVTRQAPVLHGEFGDLQSPFFDAVAGRWVPSGAGQASPDGSSYAYTTAPDIDNIVIHVADVAKGTEKTFPVALPSDIGAAVGIQVMDYDGAGVYFVVDQFEQYPIGVWRLDMATGKVTALARTGAVMAVRGGYAWGGDVDPHDPNPPRVPASRTLFDSIGRVNLTTGAQSEWYYTPGRSETLLGMSPAGWPIVNVSDAPDYAASGGEVRLLPEPHTDGESNGELVSIGVAISNPETDGDRYWFGSDNGVYLYTSAGGLQKVFAFTPEPTTAKTMSPAGFCR